MGAKAQGKRRFTDRSSAYSNHDRSVINPIFLPIKGCLNLPTGGINSTILNAEHSYQENFSFQKALKLSLFSIKTLFKSISSVL